MSSLIYLVQEEVTNKVYYYCASETVANLYLLRLRRKFPDSKFVVVPNILYNSFIFA